MKNENKNQNEVRILDYKCKKVLEGNSHVCFDTVRWEGERVGNRETVKEICAILNKGADLLKGQEIAEKFYEFVKTYCNGGEDEHYVWEDGTSVSTYAINRMTTYLRGVWNKLDRGNTKPRKVMKQMLRDLYVYMEEENGFTTWNFRQLLSDAKLRG